MALAVNANMNSTSEVRAVARITRRMLSASQPWTLRR
jgi:hypothetical protein